MSRKNKHWTLELCKIEAKKYYYPLNDAVNSNKLFDNIICLPLNLDITCENIDLYIKIFI